MTPRVILPPRSCGSRSRTVLIGNGKADAHVALRSRVGVDRGVDADDFAAHVEQRAARVAGVDRGVGLNDVGASGRRRRAARPAARR